MQLALSNRTVEVWTVSLLAQEETLRRADSLLSEDETRRANRFRYPADRRKFVMSRAALRDILARYMNTPPEKAVFEYGEYGKPRLAAPPIDVRFNLSRSGEKAIVACTLGHEIGADIEWADRDLEVDELSSRFFTAAENAALRKFQVDQRRQAFLKCWTLKEAFVKAVGKGLSLGLDAFDVSPGLRNSESVQNAAFDRFEVKGWTLIPFTGTGMDNYVSAVAIESDSDVIVRNWLNQD
jgi:4'-phosphopantetheinyl transferase